ncbi:C1A family cysteine protease [Clostridium acetobutylicum]|nr:MULTISPECIES: C1 family peptidase [Clostridium]ADZ22787.1 Cysteine protease [Clostridium acetobutylicum EA 2018]MBC2396039.1 peptidase C1 [Clostridium acetobutylicum]MBC2584933.1 peptidase C1 [Clostridium acetobutylicum]NOV90871.1 C1A family cysteine protease [Clostridium acetobutylicum]NOW16439.1 C1A family cysteine protease [Clostridium acetobutylicum]
MKIKTITTKLLMCTFTISSILLPTTAFSAQAKTKALHPLGLRTLHENIKGMKKAPKIFGATKLARSVDLSSRFPSVKDQGSLGSCVTFATTYAKTYEENQNRNWGVNVPSHFFSPSYIYSQIHSDNSADGGGSQFSDAFNLIEEQGDTSITDMPYDGSDYGWETQPTAVQREHAAQYKATDWQQLDSGNYSEIKQELAKGTPVVIGIDVYPDFDNISPSNPVFDVISGDDRGGHALCVVGYDDSKQAVKIINSWGTNWGINGYGWISYKVLQQENSDAYVLQD